jgi:hypothetical protein
MEPTACAARLAADTRKYGCSLPARSRMMDSALAVSVGRTWSIWKPGAIGPLRQNTPRGVDCPGVSFVGASTTRSFSKYTYGSMSSDAGIPK